MVIIANVYNGLIHIQHLLPFAAFSSENTI